MKKILLLFCLLPLICFGEQIVILGGGPAGLSAAIYAGRAGYTPLVIEKEGCTSMANILKLENFPGFPEGVEGWDLIDKMRDQAKRFGARFLNQEVAQVELIESPFLLQLGDQTQIFCDALIVATGIRACELGLASEKELKGCGLSTCSTCDGFFFSDREVVVIGGGLFALKEAVSLAKLASKVTLIYPESTLNGPKKWVDLVLGNPKIHLLPNVVVEEIEDCNARHVTGVRIRESETQETRLYPCEGVFVALGHQPNTELFAGQIDLDPEGYIVTEPHTTLTSIPGVFAAGDVADPRYHQVIIATGMGAQAGMDAEMFLSSQLIPVELK
jgi:thioredoxin reductase (NADPH)